MRFDFRTGQVDARQVRIWLVEDIWRVLACRREDQKRQPGNSQIGWAISGLEGLLRQVRTAPEGTFAGLAMAIRNERQLRQFGETLGIALEGVGEDDPEIGFYQGPSVSGLIEWLAGSLRAGNAAEKDPAA